MKSHNFTEAIAGYDNIITNSPDTLARLFATWDRGAVAVLLGGGGGGGAEMFSSNYEEIVSNKPAHQIAKELFLSQKRKIENIKQAKTLNLINGLNNSDINSRIERFNPSNNRELHTKIAEDIRIISKNYKNAMVNTKTINVPLKFCLYQNYPNPFNPTTKIKYDVPQDLNVTVKIYDILGKVVKILVNNKLQKAGSYSIDWNGSGFASGIYFCKIEAGDFVGVKKLILLK